MLVTSNKMFYMYLFRFVSCHLLLFNEHISKFVSIYIKNKFIFINFAVKLPRRLVKEPQLSFRKCLYINRELESDTDVEYCPRYSYYYFS